MEKIIRLLEEEIKNIKQNIIDRFEEIVGNDHGYNKYILEDLFDINCDSELLELYSIEYLYNHYFDVGKMYGLI